MKNYLTLVSKLFKIHKKKFSTNNTPLHLVLCSKISYFITPFFLYFKFSANTVTLINFFLSILSILILLFFPSYFIYSILIFILYRILDFVDGSIARFTSSGTFFGKFIDGLSDIFFQSLFVLSLSFYYFNKNQDYRLLLLGCVASILTCFDTFIHDRYSAIARWMNKDLNKNIKPYIKEDSYINFKIYLLFQDVIFFLVILLCVNNFSFLYLKINMYLIFLFFILMAVQNIFLHLTFAYKSFIHFSKITKIRNK